MDNNYSGNNYNYSSNNNYNYEKEENGFDPFGADMNSAQFGGDFYEASKEAPKTFANLQSLVLDKVVAKTFLFMTVALLITAFAALTTPVAAVLNSFYVLLIAEIAIVLIGNVAISKNNAVLAAVLYTVYSFINGMTLSVIFFLYTRESIGSVFFVTAGMFAVMTVIGMTTGKDLTKIGSMAMMALIGLILAGIVNIFVASSALDFITAAVGVVVFVGLTAYDVQKVKQMAQYSTIENENTLALFGAFQLYLDFVNLFLKLLRLMGKRK